MRKVISSESAQMLQVLGCRGPCARGTRFARDTEKMRRPAALGSNVETNVIT